MRIYLVFAFLLIVNQLFSQSYTACKNGTNNENEIDLELVKSKFVNPPVQYRMLQINHKPKLDGTLDSLKKFKLDI